MNNKRVKTLSGSTYKKGDIAYWMSRDQRVEDNWALLFAEELAEKYQVNLLVVFCLRKKFTFATERLIDFMLGGLREVEETLFKKNIPFYFLLGDPAVEIPKFINTKDVGTLVADFSPLKYNRQWKKVISQKISVPFFEVDAHNIVPVWEASAKQEFGAYTIRPKIHKLLPEFLEEYPLLKKQEQSLKSPAINWSQINHNIVVDKSVTKIEWLLPGEKAAGNKLDEFIEGRLSSYESDRNDPTKNAQSDLSPYIHFGHISAQRIVLELGKIKDHNSAKDSYIEELVVRKELSDNYCYYNENYDNPAGFPSWAQETLAKHKDDRREYTYSLEELENGRTHDELWNAAQGEMMARGKMHGYMRMYWAKKIFEWSVSVAVAQKHAIYLNDKYFLDGRDPNGYTGIAWSMGGVHDRAWFERPVFGKIRYMNYNGAKSKFDVGKYIDAC